MGKFKAGLDDGHGISTPGKRSPDGMRENEFNSSVLKYAKEFCEYNGIEIVELAPGDKDHSLKSRTDLANKEKCDVLISIHANAFLGKMGNWTGIETYIYPNSKSGRKLAEAVHSEVIKGTPLKDRGIKEANFHMLRESIMPAILLELGYMDSRIDLKYLKSEDYRRECGEEIAKGLCKYFGINYKEIPTKTAQNSSSTDYLYKVQVGAFSNPKNAEKLADQLEKKGIKTYIVKEKK